MFERVMRAARWSCVFLLALATGPLAAGQDLPAAAPARLGLDPDRLARIVTLAEEAVARQEVAGAVTLVARLGRVGHLEAVGWRDIEGRAPMETDTLFRIASMTKAVTSVAAMQLYESGALLLDDPVSMYLPAFASVQVLAPVGGSGAPLGPVDRPVTIRHLLTHTSGLSYRFLTPPQLATRYIDAGITDGLAQTPGTVGEMVDRLATLPLLHQPGARFTYSLGVDVLGRVVEVVSGRSLADYMRDEIFEPLGMVDTGFFRDPGDADRYATVYAPGPDGLVEVPADPVTSPDGRTVYSAGYPYDGPRTYHSGRRRAHLDHLRLRAVPPRPPQRRRARRRPHPGAPHRAAHDPRPPRRARGARHRPAVRARVRHLGRPRGDRRPPVGGRVRLAGLLQHRLLGRSGGAARGDHHDPALSQQPVAADGPLRGGGLQRHRQLRAGGMLGFPAPG